METGKIFGFRFTKWKLEILRFPFCKAEIFFGLRDVNRKISGFHLYRNSPGIPVNATNFRIIPFPKWKFFSGKMENPNFNTT